MNKNRAVRQTLCLRQTKIAVIPFLILFFCVMATDLFGQSPLDGFDPNANGAIQIVIVQPDGKILIGGSFSTLSPNAGPTVTRNRIARLNPDGTLDPVFNPNANGPVNTIALQSNGKVLVGGEFTTIGGQPRNRFARLDSATGAADSFDPNVNGAVWSITVQTNGKILIGGAFGTVGGQGRNHIARLDAATGQPDSFDPNASSHVYSMIEEAGGRILVSGSFTSIGGQNRNRIARLDGNTGQADSFDPNLNNTIFSMARQADGKILVGGAFTNVGGSLRNRIARIDPITGVPDSFNPDATNAVTTIAVQADGKILVGGPFKGTNSIGGQTRNHIARLDPATGLADSFDPNANDSVWSIAVQADGKVVAGGSFNGENAIGGKIRNAVARMERDGKLDQTLNLGFASSGSFYYVDGTALQPDGKILITGSFDTVLGVSRHNIARLNGDGTLDMVFDPNAILVGGHSPNTVGPIAVQVDGKILVGGPFNGFISIGGQNRNYIARLDAITGLADSFNPNVNGTVTAIAVQADGKILVAGFFNGPNSIGGQSRNYIARLDPTTGLADSFDPNADRDVYTIVPQPDGKILVGGSFTKIGGQPRKRIARLDPTTGLADSFDPDSSNFVSAIVLQDDGKIIVGGNFDRIGGKPRWRIARLDPTTGEADSFDPHATGGWINSIVRQGQSKIIVGGYFTGIGGQPRNRLARLDANTGLADSFDPDVTAEWGVDSIVPQADGKILVGGLFSAIGGQPRNLFARLSTDVAALQDLSVTQTAIAWTLEGSSPKFTRVTFETSIDNVIYLAVGNGVAVGNTWTLTGLNLPLETNLYIRARGFYQTGTRNGSESIVERVRNVFLAPTPTPCPQCARTR